MKLIERVREFHEAAGEAVNGVFDHKNERTELAHRLKLMIEEMAEVAEAGQNLTNGLMQKRGPETMRRLKAHFLKELVDLKYTVDGTALAFGWDMDGAEAEVHRSNMSKCIDGVVLKIEGKVQKGPNYSPAEMEPFVR